ncbi:hypothetical protein M0804_010904 [Polistes exclamans]|nr:hypothetical protein M0804_010904 [Polistes exclamans]
MEYSMGVGLVPRDVVVIVVVFFVGSTIMESPCALRFGRLDAKGLLAVCCLKEEVGKPPAMPYRFLQDYEKGRRIGRVEREDGGGGGVGGGGGSGCGGRDKDRKRASSLGFSISFRKLADVTGVVLSSSSSSRSRSSTSKSRRRNRNRNRSKYKEAELSSFSACTPRRIVFV